jgi:hypothetical protein
MNIYKYISVLESEFSSKGMKKPKENIAEEEKISGLVDTPEKSQENIVSHDSNQEEIIVCSTQTQKQEELNVTNCHLEKEHQVSRKSSFSRSIPGNLLFLPLFDPKLSLVFHK